MHIDSYKFGQIVIDGETYTNDCIIFADYVRDNWWRKEGHRLCMEDLQDVLEADCGLLIIGCGAYGVMKVPEEVRRQLEREGITIEALKTAEAVNRFNELSQAQNDVVAALHLTC